MTLLVRRADPEEALAVFRGLDAGAWATVEVREQSGARVVLARRLPAPASVPMPQLSGRERAVARAVAAGASNRAIAAELGVSISSVASYLRSARRKLGGARRQELAKDARLREDLAAPPSELFVVVVDLGLEGRENVLETLALLVHAESDGSRSSHSSHPSHARLTDAERAIVRALGEGRSNAEIAAARGTSSRTVANQLARLFRKVGARSRTELVARLTAG